MVRSDSSERGFDSHASHEYCQAEELLNITNTSMTSLCMTRHWTAAVVSRSQWRPFCDIGLVVKSWWLDIFVRLRHLSWPFMTLTSRNHVCFPEAITLLFAFNRNNPSFFLTTLSSWLTSSWAYNLSSSFCPIQQGHDVIDTSLLVANGQERLSSCNL